METLWTRTSSTTALVSALFCLSLCLAGCGGGGDGTKYVETDTNEVAAYFPTPPLLTVAPGLISLVSASNPAVRDPQQVVGGFITPTFPALDRPELHSIRNTAVVPSGGNLTVIVTWSDLGSDVNSVLVELRCQERLTTPPQHTVFTTTELHGLPNAQNTFTMRVDPVMSDAGYELVLALRDDQGNTSPVIRSAFIVTQLASDPAFDALSAGLMATGGENPPQFGPQQLWIPTGGTIEDSIPNGLEGAFPARVSGDVSLTTFQPTGTNQLGLQDAGVPVPRTGVVYGNSVQFVYLFCYHGQGVDNDCAGAWTTIGVGEVIEEFRLGRLEKRLLVNEVNAFLGGWNPTVPGAQLAPPGTQQPFSCPANSFPTIFSNEYIAYVR